MRRRRGIQGDEPLSDQGVNLTPLIDVVFVVLILFILIAPMVEVDRVKLAEAPQKGEVDKMVVDQEQSLMIYVHEDNKVFINKVEVPPEKLTPLLKVLHAKNPDWIPQLYQDKQAYFGTYQKVKNAVEEAGFRELDLVLEPYEPGS